ncbi:MAG: aminoacyl-tRNA hydrolase [Candidatus Muproteobacteria bacterium RBG_16_64_11]|uniref:Peptidyl-tRNA hydrolase n=1 Tax=Candidatus Muproteobacteria bacterium RBG_16_64_11 TaxID=1817758 RepID=A0A1F6T9V9_9PROT|nr:MAG: aminoacyl-tRNA hydrolase [Candidatus Muproteobacteria bacterium RBG_16_64_11]
MTQGISLIAGLGNPGPGYADTRHNAGFLFVDALVAGRADWRHDARFGGRCARVTVAGHELWLLCPDGFMNHSGEAVGRLARYYKIPPGQILVVHDDLDLPPGAVRLKFGGGDGGHNGVADVIEQLGTNEFHRLRIGIGRPSSSADVVTYVLKKPSGADRVLIDNAIQDALAQIDAIVHGQMQKAMNALHTHSR